MKVGNLFLNGTSDSEISGITVTNSTIGLFTFEGIQSTQISPRILKLIEVSYRDSLFKNPLNIIDIKGVQTTENFQVQIILASFKNLTFILGGNIVLMKSQMSNFLLLQDSSFENISGGGLRAEAFDKNIAVTSHLRIQNLITLDINTQFSSFLQVYEGGELSIYDSIVKNIYCYEDGAVLYAGYQKAIVNVYNSTFVNNTSVIGGVFIVESASLVHIYDSLITNNFAVEAGVMRAHTSGYFVFENTTITENYALSIPVGEIVDGAVTSNVTNSKIFNNKILSKTAFKTTLNFLSTKFIAYLDANPSLLNVIASEFSFQLIQGNLRLNSGTIFTNQSAIVNSFASNLYIENVTFKHIDLTSSSIKSSSSHLNIDSIEISSVNLFDQNNSFPFLQISLGSIVNINGIIFQTSAVPLLTGVFSDLDINLVNIQGITAVDNLFSLGSWYIL